MQTIANHSVFLWWPGPCPTYGVKAASKAAAHKDSEVLETPREGKGVFHATEITKNYAEFWWLA